MNVISNDVKTFVFKEMNSANKQFPWFRSAHEGYAVIKEEIEETMDAMNIVLELFSECWSGNKENKPVFDGIKAVKAFAENVACEAIQVTAMCDKYNFSLAGENADRCIECGEIIPEGRQVCPNCERKGEPDE